MRRSVATLRALALTLAFAAAFAFGGTAEASTFFSPTGPWNAPVPASPTLEPNSAAVVASLSNTIALQYAQGGNDHPNIQTTSGSIPLYRVPGGTTPQSMSVDQINGRQAGLQEAIAANNGVPFPAGATPAAGDQNDITVYDTDNKVLYEFWHASTPDQNADHRWHALAGGIMQRRHQDGLLLP
jgi:hypothetical protein